MLVKIGIGLAVGAAAFVAAVFTRPDTFAVQRSTVISAPPEVVYAQIDDLRRWPRWMTYDKIDPTTRRTYEGPARGVGSGYHYVGDKLGEGRMTIAALEPNRRVAVRAQFIKPFAATNAVEFTLAPAPGGVRVTWAMHGANTFVSKAISLFVSMDRMVGGDFEKGLADLKQVSEEDARASASAATSAAASAAS